MKNFNQIIGSCFLVLMISCQTITVDSSVKKTSSQDRDYKNLVSHGKMFTALYQQRAAEYKALCLQAYNIAMLRLDSAIAKKEPKTSLAIVTDIDETLLDNSYYAVSQAKMGKDYDPKTWEEWTAKGIAEPMEGAKDFYNTVASKGVQIFYITNRYENERKGTVENLRKHNFPLQNEKNLILRQKDSSSSKENRRKDVAKNYDIVLFLGDNLADFSEMFDKKPELVRAEAVRSLKNDFGKKFIILPNAGYGDWESAFYNYENYNINIKDGMIYDAVKTNPPK